MSAVHHEAIIDYFRAKADSYDLVEEQVYWRLSDELLWTALAEWTLPGLQTGFHFLDAGGGTGRWTDRIARRRPDATGLLFDLSSDMTREARAKAERGGYRNRIRIRNGALERVDELLDGERFQLILMLHNVLGFVQDPGDVLRRLASLLETNGRIVVFAPNRYHATYFNLATGQLDEAESASRGRGRFTPEMPPIWLFTPTELGAALAAAGLAVESMTGFPSVVYPGFQETQKHGSSQRVSALLGDSVSFDRILELEKALLAQPDVAARGNNLLAIARKHPDGR